MICCLVFNIGIGCLELRYADDSRISNEYSNVENKVADDIYQRFELDKLISNELLGYVNLILINDLGKYLMAGTLCRVF